MRSIADLSSSRLPRTAHALWREEHFGFVIEDYEREEIVLRELIHATHAACRAFSIFAPCIEPLRSSTNARFIDTRRPPRSGFRASISTCTITSRERRCKRNRALAARAS